jgi:hypothetical protein
MLPNRIRQRTDTNSNWTSVNPVLDNGEFVIESQNKAKVGNGTTHYNDLPYFADIQANTADNWNSANPVITVGELCIETDTNKMKIGTGGVHYNDLVYFGSPTICTNNVIKNPSMLINVLSTDITNVIDSNSAIVGPDFWSAKRIANNGVFAFYVQSDSTAVAQLGSNFEYLAHISLISNTSVGANDAFFVGQMIEPDILRPFNWPLGISNPISLSFYLSALSDVMYDFNANTPMKLSWSLYDSFNDKSYMRTFSNALISDDINYRRYEFPNIPPPPGISALANMYFRICISAGDEYQSNTTGEWVDGNKLCTPDCTKFMELSDMSSVIKFTGVQLEKGERVSDLAYKSIYSERSSSVNYSLFDAGTYIKGSPSYPTDAFRYARYEYLHDPSIQGLTVANTIIENGTLVSYEVHESGLNLTTSIEFKISPINPDAPSGIISFKVITPPCF